MFEVKEFFPRICTSRLFPDPVTTTFAWRFSNSSILLTGAFFASAACILLRFLSFLAASFEAIFSSLVRFEVLQEVMSINAEKHNNELMEQNIKKQSNN